MQAATDRSAAAFVLLGDALGAISVCVRRGVCSAYRFVIMRMIIYREALLMYVSCGLIRSGYCSAVQPPACRVLRMGGYMKDNISSDPLPLR